MPRLTKMGKTLGFVALLLATAGCKPVKQAYYETFFDGTVEGVLACIKYTSSSLLTDETVRNSCAAQFEQPVFDSSNVGGRARPMNEQGYLVLNGSVENRATENVVTSMAAVIEIFAADGKETKYSGRTPLWLEPRKKEEFSIRLDDDTYPGIESLPGCEDDTDENVSCWLWYTTNISAVSLN